MSPSTPTSRIKFWHVHRRLSLHPEGQGPRGPERSLPDDPGEDPRGRHVTVFDGYNLSRIDRLEIRPKHLARNLAEIQKFLDASAGNAEADGRIRTPQLLDLIVDSPSAGSRFELARNPSHALKMTGAVARYRPLVTGVLSGLIV